MLEMLNTEGVVLEPAGALAIDVLGDLGDLTGKRVVCVCSGGNFDFERLPEVKERAQRFAGVKKYFVLRLPQRPGALRDFLELLGPDDDVARCLAVPPGHPLLLLLHTPASPARSSSWSRV